MLFLFLHLKLGDLESLIISDMSEALFDCSVLSFNFTWAGLEHSIYKCLASVPLTSLSLQRQPKCIEPKFSHSFSKWSKLDLVAAAWMRWSTSPENAFFMTSCLSWQNVSSWPQESIPLLNNGNIGPWETERPECAILLSQRKPCLAWNCLQKVCMFNSCKGHRLSAGFPLVIYLPSLYRAVVCQLNHTTPICLLSKYQNQEVPDQFCVNPRWLCPP